MAKIISRNDQRGQLITFLQEVVRVGIQNLSGNEIEEDEIQVEATLEGLIEQVDDLVASQLFLINTLQAELEQLLADLAGVKIELELSQELNSKLVDDIGYDSSLDEATGDLMQSLVASGIADFAPDGEIIFDNRVLVGRSDLKPILRDAIVTWIEKRLSE